MQAELAKAKGQKPLIAFRVPGFTEGFIAKAGDAVRAAGDVFPQAKVRNHGRDGRFDDVAGRGFMILGRHGDPAAALPAELRAYWTRLGGAFVNFGDEGVADIEHFYRRLMDEYGCEFMIKRPDYYFFGACAGAESLPALVADIRTQLGAAAA